MKTHFSMTQVRELNEKLERESVAALLSARLGLHTLRDEVYLVT